MATQQNNNTVGRILTFLTLVALFILVFVGGFLFGRFDDARSGQPVPLLTASLMNTQANGRVNFAPFWKAWDLLKDHYVDRDNLDAQKLMEGAIMGMYKASGDPYTTFLDQTSKDTLAEDLEGRFDGIGAEIGLRDDLLTIIAPLDDSPAQKAGLLPGDKVVSIDGVSALDISIDEALHRIRGKRGTSVVLTVFHEGANLPEDITVVRDEIVVKSVTSDLRENGRIGFIRIAQFGENTDRELYQALMQLKKNKKIQGIVIDLRNNPGGFLDVAIKTISFFVPKNTVAVIEQDAKGNRKQRRTTTEGFMQERPIVILVNQGSASASEIFAAALKEQRSLVQLVGDQTFGKGSVQELLPLTSSSAVKITVAKWLTPQGKQINHEGIAPDVVVDYTQEDFENGRDPQYLRALDILKQMITQKAQEHTK